MTEEIQTEAAPLAHPDPAIEAQIAEVYASAPHDGVRVLCNQARMNKWRPLAAVLALHEKYLEERAAAEVAAVEAHHAAEVAAEMKAERDAEAAALAEQERSADEARALLADASEPTLTVGHVDDDPPAQE